MIQTLLRKHGTFCRNVPWNVNDQPDACNNTWDWICSTLEEKPGSLSMHKGKKVKVPVFKELSIMPWRHTREWRYNFNFLDLGTSWR
jgi:hypothetical protein